MLNFQYHSTHNGFCRVYYKAKERKKLYCMQLTMGGNFELLACSREGEPEAPIRNGFVASIEPPKGDESTDTELREFLKRTPIEQINAEYA